MLAAIRNLRWSDEQFFKVRNEEALPQWETGKALQNLDECIDAAKELSKGKNVAQKLKAAKETGS